MTVLGIGGQPDLDGYDTHDLTLRLDFAPGNPDVSPKLVVELPGFDIYLTDGAAHKLVTHATRLLESI